MGFKLDKIKANWENVRHSSRFHNLLVFLMFVIMAAIFWLVMVMNDNVQKNIDVTMTITAKPDSVTFITLPPTTLHVSVRDRGTRLFRVAVFKNLHIEFNFKEFADNGVFRLSPSDIFAALRAKLGSDAQINTVSVDSVSLPFTTLPGKRVPVDVISHLSSANGFVIMPALVPSSKIVTVYSTDASVLDTIHKIKTQTIVRNNLSKSTHISVKLQQPALTRVEPASIMVKIPVEPLVSKEINREIKVIGVPENENVLLFPAMATVSVYVPMSKFNDDVNISLEVNYNQLRGASRKLPVTINNLSEYCANPVVKPDSVEYTLVR